MRKLGIKILLVLIIGSTLSLSMVQCCNEKPQTSLSVSSGKVVRLDSFASQFVQARNIDVWLPDGYSEKESYPVVYMHDGQMLFDTSITWNKQEWMVDEVFGYLIEEERIPPCIVVGIWNNGKHRRSEYFPQKPFESFPQCLQDSLLNKALAYGKGSLFYSDICSDDYLRFIVEELKPHIDKEFSTQLNPSQTYMVGSSMGGLISIYALCEYPEIFGGVACLSTHWTGTHTTVNNPIPDYFAQYLEQKLPSPGKHRIYFDHGTETLDSLYHKSQAMVDAVMKGKGYDKNNWLTPKFHGADHSETAWQERLRIPVAFLLKKD